MTDRLGRKSRAAAVLLCVVCITSPVFAQAPTKISASDSVAFAQFGYSVSVSGEYAIVGARFDGENGPESGSAYVYHFDVDGWSEQQKLLPSDPAQLDEFGRSVAIWDDFAIVGAVGTDDNGNQSGSAYVFQRGSTSWVERQKLTVSDAAANDFFGVTVSIANDVAIIGAPNDDDKGAQSGSAYVYRFDGSVWVEEQKLTADTGAFEDNFGWSVSISGDKAVVGVPFDDDNGEDSGSAIVFHYDGSNWTERQKLVASGGADFDPFGYSVSVSGDVIVVGSYNEENGNSDGAAYVYRFDGSSWSEEQKLTTSDGAPAGQFGFSVSVAGDYVGVGARFDDDNGSFSGSAYVFRFDGSTWLEEQKILAGDGADSDRFGESVSVSDAFIVVGAPRDDVGEAQDAGSVWVADLVQCDAGVGKRSQRNSGDCSGLIEILTPVAGDFFYVDSLFEITWRHSEEPDDEDSLIIAYTDSLHDDFAWNLTPVDTVAGDVESYEMRAPNLSSRQSAIVIKKLKSGEEFNSQLFTFRGYHLVRTRGDTLQHFTPSLHGWPFSNSRINLFPDAGWYDTYDQFNYGSGTDPFSGAPYLFPAFFANNQVFPDWPSFVRAFGHRFAYPKHDHPPSGLNRTAMMAWRKENGGSRWGGSCAGMVTTAFMKFVDPVRFDSVASETATPAGFRELSSFDASRLRLPATTGPAAVLVPTPREIINSRQNYFDGISASRFFLQGVQLRRDPRQLIVHLKALFAFEANGFYPSSYLYFRELDPAASGAHAVLPYKLERIKEVDGGWRIYIYDPNRPRNNSAFIVVDSTLNAWRYDALHWDGSDRSIFMMDPIDNYFGEAEYMFDGASKNGSTPAGSLIRIGVTPGAHAEVTAPDGSRMSYGNGADLDEIDAGYINIPPVGGLTPPKGFVVEAGLDYVVRVGGFPDTLVHVQFNDGTRIIDYQRTAGETTQSDQFAFRADGLLEITNPDADARRVNVLGIEMSSIGEIAVGADRLAISQSDSVQFGLTGRQLRLASRGGDTTYDLRLELGTETGRTVFLSRNVSLAAGAVHTTAVQWDSLGTDPVRVDVDLDGDGATDAQIVLDNQATNTAIGDAPERIESAQPVLEQNYPNPFSERSTIAYSLSELTEVRLTVFDILGRTVRILASGTRPPGSYTVAVGDLALPSGVYFYRLEAGEFVATRRMTIAK